MEKETRERLVTKLEIIIDFYKKLHKANNRDLTENLIREIECLKKDIENCGY